jgi:hypothetical protein
MNETPVAVSPPEGGALRGMPPVHPGPAAVGLVEALADRPEGGVGLAKERADRPRRPFAAMYVLPLVLLLAWIALPLARGTETLYMRDVLNAHLAMKWSQARALRQGYFPLLDPYRGGGQPLAGNPNAVPFYPTNVLYLWGSPFWALNAHFWIHLLLAPFAFYWMARRWGLAREPAWAAAVCWAVSGFYLSHLSFYNLIAGATLAPALVAACLGFAGTGAPGAGEEARRRGSAGVPRRALYAPAIAALWGLLLLSGDPLMAAMAGCLAAVALLMRWQRRAWGPPLAMLGAAFACGTLIAMPQIVEFLRILPVSFRGFRGYTGGVATIASWDPRQGVEWLLPMIFGRLDVRGGGNFWGQRFFTGAPPLYPSFYPGALALALIAAAGRPRCRAAWWGWGAVVAGLFCSLGRFNPAMSWLIARLGGGALRYPVKFWLPVAAGAALLCGLGFERLLAASSAPATPGAATAEDAVAAADAVARRRFGWTLGVLGLAYGALWAFLNLLPGPATKLLRLLIPAERPLAFVANERLRWAGLCFFSLLIVGALALLARRMNRSPRAAWTAGGLLLAAHAVTQVMLLRPLYPTDAVTPYRVPPPAISYLPRDSTVVNPEFEHLFGPSGLTSGNFPSPELKWLERRAFYEMFPFTGPLWERRYELDESPEGLDTYLTRMVQGSLKDATDAERLRLLAAWGVGRLVIERALAPLPSNARLLAELPSFGQRLRVYEVVGRTPEVFLARRVWLAPQMNGALRRMKSPAFDPRWDAVVPGSGPPRQSAGGTVRTLRRGPESLVMDLDVGSTGSLLVVQRALLIYRATIDGRLTPLIVANLHRNGLLVPAGHHRVRMWVDRTNFHRSIAVAGFGLACLPALAAWGGWGRLGWRRRRLAAGTVGVAGAGAASGAGAAGSGAGTDC